MKAARIHNFGPPDVVVVEDVPAPTPGPGEVLVRVMAAGVAPWDATIREGMSKVSPQPPLTLGSDLSGVVEKVGPGVTGFAPADEVYGVTNPQFCGAQAELAVAAAGMVARKPQSLDYLEAASAPVIAITAWQMLFQYAQAMRGQTVMVVGAAGNVGAYAVQMAVDSGIQVIAIAHPGFEDLLRSFGAKSIIDSSKPGSEQDLPQVDAILDTVGGTTFQRCVAALKPGGKLVTVVSTQPLPAGAVFFYAEVTTARLETLATLFDAGRITARVGSILPLSEARQAQSMLAGTPHKYGKIVLQIASVTPSGVGSGPCRKEPSMNEVQVEQKSYEMPPREGFTIAHFLTVADIDRSARFYEKVFDGRILSTGDSEGAPAYIQIANTWLLVNVGGGPTPDKPSVTLSVPDPDKINSFMNIRVADIQACYELWKSRGAEFITEPIPKYGEIRCYIRDPDGYIIEVGQSTELKYG